MILDFEARFLDQMEEIYAAIVQSTNDLQVNELLRRKTHIRRDFAKRLVTLGYPQLIGSRTKSLDFKNDLKRPVYPAWFVEGMPSKKGRTIAEKWMLSRKLRWGGRTKSLRHEVENALVLGETVPRFGFEIELTTLHRINYINQTPRSQLTDNVVDHI